MQIRNTINQSVRQMPCLIRQKNSLFKLGLETDCWCIDEKNVNESKGFMVGGKKTKHKTGKCTFTSLLEGDKSTVPILRITKNLVYFI